MDESGITAKEHFVKQRRNLVIICIATFLFKLHQSYPFIKPLGFFETNDSNNFYTILSLFLIALIYTSIRYFQAMLVDQDFMKIRSEFNKIRDIHLLYTHKVLVDSVYEGVRESERPELPYDMEYYDVPISKFRLTIDHDCGGKIHLEDRKAGHKWEKIEGINYIIRRFIIGYASFLPFFRYALKHQSIFEYIFPIIFSFFAVIEVLGFHTGHAIINKLSQFLEWTNSLLNI